MQVTETLAQGLKRELKVVVSAADIEEKVNHRLVEVSHTVSLPGFRPGKVPMPFLKKKYGPSVLGEVLERAVNEGGGQAMMERNLRPAMQPKVEINSFAEGKDLEFTMAFEILPEVEVSDFSKIEVEKLKVKAAEDEVQKALERIAESQRKTEAVTDGSAAKQGDILVIDFVGSVDGVEFPGGKAEGYSLELGSNTFIPGFEDQLVGAKAGSDVLVKVKFPAEYGAPNLAGKDAEFACKVHEVRKKVPMTIDDELAKAAGKENLDALKSAVREEIERDYSQVSRMRMKRALLDKLSDAHNFDVPEGLIDAEFEGIWKQLEEAKAKDQLDEADKAKSEDELKAEYRKIAERRVRLGILLSEVGRRNNIQVTQEDVNRAIVAEARRFPGQEALVFRYYQNNQEALNNLKAPLYEDKVVDFVLEMVKVNERETSVEDLMKDPDESAASGDSGEAAKPKKKAAPKKKKTEE